MELTNEFTVGVPVEETWKVLTDVERIAPCLPGAELQEIDGEEYRGIVKIKVGPITAQYKGVASFQEKDDTAHKAVLKAEGRDTRGQGNASALITATLAAEGSSTRVKVVTDLTITGKVAQFGRGVLADVSTKLIGQFAEALDKEVQRGSGESGGGSQNGSSAAAAGEGATEPPAAAPTAATGPRKIQSRPAEPVDLLGTAGSPVAKRVGPIVGVLVVVLWLMRRRKKKRK